ncbi:MAG TPA: TetR/AcrR family transcriptional regulator, partial [Nocardioidaceae bacterium]|nr:TetR/AcrR family transcriptional regulator [Nocardioidaceae bacterium]
HRETSEEIVEHALAVMAESGAAGLSLGEVARRMHMRTPSLYGYFGSKAALYDEVFARGWRAFEAAMRPHAGPVPRGGSLRQHLEQGLTAALDWSAAHPAYSQLMFWRPVPQWRPTAGSYAAAVAAKGLATETMSRLREEGHLDRTTDVPEAVEVWSLMSTGLISQHMSNEPGVPVPSSLTGALVSPLVSAFIAQYGSRSAA